MRKVRVPDNITIWSDRDNKKVPYSFHDYLREAVWPESIWRDDEAHFAAKSRLKRAFHGVEPGSIAKIESKDFEKFQPVALMRGKNINPQLEDDLEPFHAAVMFAPVDDDEGEKSE